ncbi:Carbohydrate sulfotransferase 15 [Dissostichus eleginoides]|uniref:Carbohydrate sulfotransferase 15 n=1 Tax=Dissostichus eleginoides TaxID=100907 RepID=A0AAD9CNK7_DISEL|nr:Carbohydrate sulfotransferase 15 [Dissostichus eleginoides]
MSLSDCKYGSNTHTDYTHSLHSLPMAENYGKRPVRTSFDVNKNLDIKWSLRNLKSISKVKVFSFLMGLTLTFLVTASYILTWDRKGLLQTPSTYQLRPVVILTSTAAAEAPSGNNLIDMKLLAKNISSKLEYTPRKVPDEKDVVGTDSNLFSVIPRHFLPGIKSPCWYEEFSSERSTDLYRRNLFTRRSKTFKTVCDHLRTNFQQHLFHRGSKVFRLRCLPYFYIIGQPKCGTTDLFNRLLLHPEVKFNTMKEPHWWTRKRFGYIRFKAGFQESFPVEDYLDLFDLAAQNIQEGISEASASTMWDNKAWSYLPSDREGTEPPFLAQDFIHTVQPGAKILIMLRDPVERLYSDYLYFKMANKSAEHFHQKVVDSQPLQRYAGEATFRDVHHLLAGLADSFQQRADSSSSTRGLRKNLEVTIKKVFDFLSVGPLSLQGEAALTKRPLSNTRRTADRNLGPMLPATTDFLREFHKPFNHKLASVLDNKAFLWSNT